VGFGHAMKIASICQQYLTTQKLPAFANTNIALLLIAVQNIVPEN
jgi:hypothetical protein